MLFPKSEAADEKSVKNVTLGRKRYFERTEDLFTTF